MEADRQTSQMNAPIKYLQTAQQIWANQNDAWRDPMQITTHWMGAEAVQSELVQHQVSGQWWHVLEQSGMTIIVTREYEHLVLGLTVKMGKPQVSYLSLPHPSGIAVDVQRKMIHIASTRNPNVIFDFAPASHQLTRLDVERQSAEYDDEYSRALLPYRTRFYPGCFYMHDLGIIDGLLYANSVGQNAIVRLDESGGSELVWWPKCIEKDGKPVFGQNHIQLNSIAAGRNIAASFFSASAAKLSARRPGHRNFPVDRRGVLFSGETREPIAFGLTRPHSARLYNGNIYVDNSGYGELVVADGDKFNTVARLPGWTRGLAFHNNIAFVGTSRVIPRFRQYAPGIDVEQSRCGLHAVDLETGKVLGSIYWPYGNQVFAIELAPREMAFGFVTRKASKRSLDKERKFYYTHSV
jgi:uncharacterized protein (TIGR03032 family)